MKTFDKHKKTITMVLLLAIFFSCFSFLTLPKKAKAIVPVLDGANLAVNEFIAESSWMTSVAVSGLAFKEVGPLPGINPAGAAAGANVLPVPRTFDGIAYLVLKQFIRSLLNDIIGWVKGGFNGQPVFVSDTERFFTDAALNASGIYLEYYLDPDIYDYLCAPWRLPVYEKLTQVRREGADLSNIETYPRCTLATVIENAEGFGDFVEDFRKGGWDAWFSLMADPTNMPMGLYLETVSTMQEKEDDSREKAKTEEIAGQGFISLFDCEKETPGKFCEMYQIKSPGKWIENQVSEWTTTDLASLEMADELDELIQAFIGVLLHSFQSSLLYW